MNDLSIKAILYQNSRVSSQDLINWMSTILPLANHWRFAFISSLPHSGYQQIPVISIYRSSSVTNFLAEITNLQIKTRPPDKYDCFLNCSLDWEGKLRKNLEFLLHGVWKEHACVLLQSSSALLFQCPLQIFDEWGQEFSNLQQLYHEPIADIWCFKV